VSVSDVKAVSLRLPEELLKESDECAMALGISRAEYILRAIQRMNRESKTEALEVRLADASHRARKKSMRVNAEFARIEHDPDA
jgi:metal-responsive CopG/Arc/MetJ family transcriptional regulator